MPAIGKLGRLAHNPARLRMCLQAHEVLNLSTLPSRPAGNDWSQHDGIDTRYPMFRNDQLGICGIASLLHRMLTWSGQTGVPFVATDEDAVDGYRRFGGYVDGRPETDGGVVMLDVIDRLVSGETLAGQTIRARVAVDPRNDDLWDAACEFFGGLWIGLALPKAWQSADTWDVSPTGSTSGAWAPWSWGGHAVDSPLYSPTRDGIITWTEHVPLTVPARRLYVEEAYALLDEPMWARLQQRCPAGLDLQKLIDLMAVVGK